MKNKSEKILITGGSGFIGKHVIKCLLKKNYSLIVLARKKNKYDFDKDVNVIYGDLTDFSLKDYINAGKPNRLLHLAWGRLTDFNNPEHISKEYPFHLDFIKKMIDYGVKNITVTGTGLEYGLIEGPLEENFKCSPTTNYGKAKLKLLVDLIDLQKSLKFKLNWLRLFYVYGDDQKGKSIFPSLKKAIENDDQYFKMSHGNQIRDYLSIEALSNLISIITIINKNYGVVNICSGKNISLNETLKLWLKKYNWDITIKRGFYNIPEYEPLEFWGDRIKLNKILSDNDYEELKNDF